MQRASIAAAAGLAALATASSALAQSHFAVGVLTCTAKDRPGLIDGSTRDLLCHFVGRDRDKWYRGSIRRFGRAIGSAQQERIAWTVVAPSPEPWSRFLVGSYTTLGAGAAAGGDVGADALVGGGATELGGPQGSIILQPLKGGTQEGVSIAAAVASLGLRTTRRPRRRD